MCSLHAVLRPTNEYMDSLMTHRNRVSPPPVLAGLTSMPPASPPSCVPILLHDLGARIREMERLTKRGGSRLGMRAAQAIERGDYEEAARIRDAIVARIGWARFWRNETGQLVAVAASVVAIGLLVLVAFRV